MYVFGTLQLRTDDTGPIRVNGKEHTLGTARQFAHRGELTFPAQSYGIPMMTTDFDH